MVDNHNMTVVTHRDTGGEVFKAIGLLLLLNVTKLIYIKSISSDISTSNSLAGSFCI